MSKEIKEAKIDLYLIAYPHEEDDLYNVRVEGRLGDEILFDVPANEGTTLGYIFDQMRRNLGD